ncbi:MAG TPA: hypothetical protein ENH94_00505 [Phycisphaerales bacterium]|nr:hypothetical protein [Phycisphaerales bacterium]
MPRAINYRRNAYYLQKIFKHDFFAATALYTLHLDTNDNCGDVPEKIILKVGCHQFFFGIPMAPVGLFLSGREIRNLRRLKGFDNVPQLLGEYGRYGFLYKYIEGKTLAEAEDVSEEFFDKLAALLTRLHAEDFVYLDMNKRTNILIGADGQAHIIDFQISFHIAGTGFLLGRLFRKIRRRLQREDWYHLYKHKRKVTDKGLTYAEIKASRNPSLLIRMHRIIATPLRKGRRRILRNLFGQQRLKEN